MTKQELQTNVNRYEEFLKNIRNNIALSEHKIKTLEFEMRDNGAKQAVLYEYNAEQAQRNRLQKSLTDTQTAKKKAELELANFVEVLIPEEIKPFRVISNESSKNVLVQEIVGVQTNETTPLDLENITTLPVLEDKEEVEKPKTKKPRKTKKTEDPTSE